MKNREVQFLSDEFLILNNCIGEALEVLNSDEAFANRVGESELIVAQLRRRLKDAWNELRVEIRS